jgi:hypothetical protein
LFLKSENSRRVTESRPVCVGLYDGHTQKKNLGIYDGELPHSFWSGTATMLQRLGAPQEDIARHVGWQSTQMVGLYAQKDKVLGISSSPPTALICTI